MSGESCSRPRSCGPWIELRGWGGSTFSLDSKAIKTGRYQFHAQALFERNDESKRSLTFEFTNACSPGYTVDAAGNCADIDECLQNNGGCDLLTTCTNTPGSRTCGECPTGYAGIGASGCMDIDECATANGGCDALSTCTNTPGSRTCSACPVGFSGTGDAGCTDIDECATANGGCDVLSTCTNTPGSRTCGTCPAGFSGTGDAGCADIDECATANGGCDVLSTCTNTPGSRTCGTCPAGFLGTGDTGCTDTDECLISNGGCDLLTTCINTPGSRVCGICPTGYSGTGDTGCADIDECLSANGGCDVLTSCENTLGGRVCGPCPTGYQGTGEFSCVDVNECLTANGGCDQVAACTNTPGGRTCGACPAGYTGTGDTACTDIDECLDANGGCASLTTCTNTPGGRDCSACPVGYSGTGDTVCADIDECATSNGGCDLLTACTNVPGSRTCSACPTGFTGTGDSACTDINECLIENGGCDPLTDCTNTPGSHMCGKCPNGYVGHGNRVCIDIDECVFANGGCDPLASCTNTLGTYNCGPCPAGYEGNGDIGCTQIIDNCTIANGGCDPLAVCIPTPSSRICGACPVGYTGDGDTGCVDIDECLTQNGGCDSHTDCINTPGSHTCGPCPSGHEGTGDTLCMLQFVASELVGRPTNHSITVNVMAGEAVEAYFEYGLLPDAYGESTQPTTYADGIIETVIDGLVADTQYYYRTRYRPAGSSAEFLSHSEYTFHTQRQRTSSFTFAVQSDSHQGYASFHNDSLYRVTMGNILSEHPDFLVDLGDTVSTDDTTETQASVRQKYLNQRTVFDLAAHSTPVFLALGNHENEEGWNLDDMGADRQNSLPVLGANARKRYFLNPVSDGFYSGNNDPLPELDGDHLREDYYAYEWGSALFVVIDPFWYTTKKPYSGTTGGEKEESVIGNRWDWTLGDEQYQWLKATLESSTATFKFVFAHQQSGGTEDYGRAGAKAAKYCEWGGYDIDGVTWSFESHRPGWELPIHQLFVKTNVSAFFHGHDHFFAKEDLDGVVYQEVPHAANSDYGMGFSTNAADYADGVRFANSGHLRVTVAPTGATVDYVRSYLPGGGTNGFVEHSYLIPPCDTQDTDSDGINNCTDGCRSDPLKVAPGACGCGKLDTDTDNDGALDCKDRCPTDPLKTAPGSCGCNQPDNEGCCVDGVCLPSTFMVVRVGTGGSALSTTSTAAFIEERRLGDGEIANTIALPTSASGTNQPLTLAGSATVEGTLKRSADGHWVTLGGYAVGTGTTNVAQTATTTVNRVVARVALDRTVDTSTLLTSAFSGTSGNNSNPRAVVTDSGNNFWIVGAGQNNTGGIWQGTFGTSTATQITGQTGNNPGAVRTCDIFNDQLYASTNVSPFFGVFTVGVGLPVSQATATLLPGFPSAAGTPAASPVDFVVLDRDPTVAGADTVYLSDDRATSSGGGIQKWTFNGSTWTLAYTLNTSLTTGVRHLLAISTPGSVTLLAGTTSTANSIVKVEDIGSTSAFSTVATAGSNTAFRGLALPPVP